MIYCGQNVKITRSKRNKYTITEGKTLIEPQYVRPVKRPTSNFVFASSIKEIRRSQIYLCSVIVRHVPVIVIKHSVYIRGPQETPFKQT